MTAVHLIGGLMSQGSDDLPPSIRHRILMTPDPSYDTQGSWVGWPRPRPITWHLGVRGWMTPTPSMYISFVIWSTKWPD